MPEGEVRIRISARDDATAQMGAVTKAVKQLVGAWLGFKGVKKLVSEIQDVIGGFAAYAEQIDKANKITGISTDSLQRLAYAAEQEGTSLDQVSGSLKFLVRNMQSAKEGSEESKKAFNNIQVSATNADGSLRSVEDVFYEVAEAIRNTTNDTDAMSIALDLFGKSGTDIIPLAKLGAQGLKDLGDEAAKMGKVLDNITIREGKMFADQMTRVKNEVEATKLAIAKDLMPSLYEMLIVVSNLTKVYEGFSNAVRFAMMRLPRDFENSVRATVAIIKEWEAEFKKQEAAIFSHLTGLIRKWSETDKARRAALAAWLSETKTLDAWLSEIEERDAWKPTRAYMIELAERLEHINQVIPEIDHGFDRTKESILDLVPGIQDASFALEDTEDQFSELNQALIQYGHAFLDNVIDNFVEGRTAWNQLFADFMKSIMKMIIKMAALKAISIGLKAIGLESGGVIPKKQHGGMIPGGPPYTDRVLIAGMPGEGVLNHLGMATLGREDFERLNRGQNISNAFGVNIYIQGNADQNAVRNMELMLRKKLPAMIKDAERRRQI